MLTVYYLQPVALVLSTGCLYLTMLSVICQHADSDPGQLLINNNQVRKTLNLN